MSIVSAALAVHPARNRSQVCQFCSRCATDVVPGITTVRRGRIVDIQPPIRLSTNNIVVLKEAVSMGLGMAVLPRWFVDDELRSGSLVDVLPEWRAPSLPIRIAYLPGRHQPRRLRAFLDFLSDAVAKIDGITPP